MTKGLRIGQLAAEFGLNPKTLRYYEAIGLLPAPQRTPAGYRLYRSADRDQVDFILKARAIGFTLEEIGQVLELRRVGRTPCEHVQNLLSRKVAAIDEQLHALADVRRELVGLHKEAAGGAPLDAHICPIIERHQYRVSSGFSGRPLTGAHMRRSRAAIRPSDT